MHTTTRAAGLLAAAAATIACTAGCKLPDPAATPPQQQAPPEGHPVDYPTTFDAVCNVDGSVASYGPDTPAALAHAKRACAELDRAIDNAPWPSGVHIPGRNQ